MRFRHHSEKLDQLRKVPMFASLSDHHLEAIARHADEVEAREGEVLVREGEVAHEMIILVDAAGRVERHGKQIGEVGPGDTVGEMAVLDGKPRSATVQIDRPGTLLVIHSRELSPLLESTPGMARHMLVSLSGRLRELQKRFVD